MPHQLPAVTPRVEVSGPDHLVWFDEQWRPRPEWFDPAWLAAQGLVRGEAVGRGATVFAELRGRPLVLRHYRRGGAVRELLGDRYAWLGLRASRAWRELALLARLQAAGLPVPPPVAARVARTGALSPCYRADLLTERLPGTRSLAQALGAAPLDSGAWKAIGATIARFHDVGLEHADLNAHNILLDAHGAVFLIDFDRGRLRSTRGRWCERNLRRLRRSLDKLDGLEPAFGFDETGWAALTAGYRAAVGTQE